MNAMNRQDNLEPIVDPTVNHETERSQGAIR